MIQLYHVYKSYQKGKNVLEDITFGIKRGEFSFLVGPSGAGKTTLLKILFCAEKTSSGQVIVNDESLSNIKQKDIPYLRRSIGVVFQDFKLLNNRKVFDNVALPLEILDINKNDIRRRVSKVLRSVGLKYKEEKYPLELSGGEQQRVAIARAIVNNPSILLADEPTGNLDPEKSVDIMSILADINAMGTTVLVATHDKFLLEKFPKRKIKIKDGKLIEEI
ncbi:cell division ATP-binding protein FtsE [Thermodesulfobacteriota bacterium]